MKKSSTSSILPLPQPSTTVIVAAVLGTVVLSDLAVPTNGQIRRLRTHRLSYHGRGFGRSIAADVRRRDRASLVDLGRDPDERKNTKLQQRQRQSGRKAEEKTQKRKLQPLFLDDDGFPMEGDNNYNYEYEYDFDYVIPEGTLPDDAIGMFDDPLATPSIFEDGAVVPELPPEFPFPEEGKEEEEGEVAIVSNPTLDFSFSFPFNSNVPFLDGGNGNSEEDSPAEIAESGLFAPGLDEDHEDVSTMPSPTKNPTQDSFFETTAIDLDEDAFLGIPSLSMSFGMPNSDETNYYSMSMSMMWTFEPSVTPPATEPPSSPRPSATPAVCPGPPAKGCVNGMYNFETCQCDCIPPFCRDAMGECNKPLNNCGENPWRDCELGVNCPWWPGPIVSETCVTGNSVPAGIWDIYPSRNDCCLQSYPYSKICDANEGTSAPTKYPTIASSPVEELEIAPIPSLLPTSEVPTPFMGLSMDYDMSLSMDYEMSVGVASGSDDGYETIDTGMSMDYDDGGTMSMSMSMDMSIPMPTTSQTTPYPTLLVQDLPYIPTNGNNDYNDNGNDGGLIPAEGSTTTNAPTSTVGGGAVGDGAFPTEESFGRAVPATGPSSPSSSSFGITSIGMRFAWALIGIEGLRMMLVV